MSDFAWGLLAGFAAVLVVAGFAKWRRRNNPMGVAEKAEYLSKRRARMLPALAVIFLSQQASFFSQMSESGHVSAEKAKISAWLVLSAILLLGLATKGFWFEKKQVRDLIDDENTRANRNEAMRWGFLFAMEHREIVGPGIDEKRLAVPIPGADRCRLPLQIGLEFLGPY